MAYKTKIRYGDGEKDTVLKSMRLRLEHIEACRDLCEMMKIPNSGSNASVCARALAYLIENVLFTRSDFPRHDPEVIAIRQSSPIAMEEEARGLMGSDFNVQNFNIKGTTTGRAISENPNFEEIDRDYTNEDFTPPPSQFAAAQLLEDEMQNAALQISKERDDWSFCKAAGLFPYGSTIEEFREWRKLNPKDS